MRRQNRHPVANRHPNQNENKRSFLYIYRQSENTFCVCKFPPFPFYAITTQGKKFITFAFSRTSREKTKGYTHIYIYAYLCWPPLSGKLQKKTPFVPPIYDTAEPYSVTIERKKRNWQTAVVNPLWKVNRANAATRTIADMLMISNDNCQRESKRERAKQGKMKIESR